MASKRAFDDVETPQGSSKPKRQKITRHSFKEWREIPLEMVGSENYGELELPYIDVRMVEYQSTGSPDTTVLRCEGQGGSNLKAPAQCDIILHGEVGARIASWLERSGKGNKLQVLALLRGADYERLPPSAECKRIRLTYEEEAIIALGSSKVFDVPNPLDLLPLRGIIIPPTPRTVTLPAIDPTPVQTTPPLSAAPAASNTATTTPIVHSSPPKPLSEHQTLQPATASTKVEPVDPPPMQSLVEARKTAVGPPLISSSKHEGGVKVEQTDSSVPVSLHTTLVAAFLATPAESSHKRSPSPGNAGIPVSTSSRALDVAPFTTPHPVAPTRQDASQNASVRPLDSLASSPINAHASGSVPPTQPEKENLKPRKSRAQRQAASKAKEIARASGQPTMSPTSPPTPAGVIHLPTAPADVENNINESASPLEESPTIEPKIAMMDPTLNLEYHLVKDFSGSKGVFFHLIGLVTRLKDPNCKGPNDYLQTITIEDQVSDGSDVSFTLFGPLSHLPGNTVHEGDILLIHGLKKNKSNAAAGTGWKHKWSWSAYSPTRKKFYGPPAESACDGSCRDCETLGPKIWNATHKLNELEKEYMVDLGEWRKDEFAPKGPVHEHLAARPPPRQGKTRLIKDAFEGRNPEVGEKAWCSLVVEILAISQFHSGLGWVDLWVTDYTAHPGLLDDEDYDTRQAEHVARHARELFRSQRVIHLKLYDAFSDKAGTVQLGHLFRFRNVMVSKNRMLRNPCMDGEVKQRGDLEHADMERLGADAPDFDLREFRKNRDAFMKDRPTTYILEGDERASTRPKLNPSRNDTLPSYPKPSSPGPSKPSPRLKGADEAYRPVPYRSLETQSANQNARNTPRSPIKPPIALPAPAPPAPAPAPAPIGRPGHRSSFLDEPPPQMEIDEPPPSQGAATESVSSSQQPALWPSNDEPPTTASSAPNNDPFIMSRPTNGRANTEFTMDLSMLPSFQSIARMKGLMQRRLKLHNDSVTSTAQQSAPPSLYHRFEGKVVDYFPREVTQLAIAICPLCNVEVGSTKCKQHPEEKLELYWNFQLEIQDRVGESLYVVLRDDDASTFLGNPPTQDKVVCKELVRGDLLGPLMKDQHFNFCAQSRVVPGTNVLAWHLVNTKLAVQYPEDSYVQS